MPGITPNEGELYVANKVYVNGNLKVGLWTGTWNGEEDVTHGEATARFTKLAGNGFDPVTLSSWSRTTDGSGNTKATHPDVIFTRAGTAQNVDGYYIATEDNKLLHVERDPNATASPHSPVSVGVGQRYLAGLSNAVQ